LVPAYTFPENRQDLSVLPVVVRNGFSHDLSDLFLSHLSDAVTYLSSLSTPLPPEPGGYHH
jgi:glutamate decarboxylase